MINPLVHAVFAPDVAWQVQAMPAPAVTATATAPVCSLHDVRDTWPYPSFNSGKGLPSLEPSAEVVVFHTLFSCRDVVFFFLSFWIRSDGVTYACAGGAALERHKRKIAFNRRGGEFT